MDDQSNLSGMSKGQSLCHKCRRLGLMDKFTLSALDPKMPSTLHPGETICIGSYFDIVNQHACPFCRLVLQLLPLHISPRPEPLNCAEKDVFLYAMNLAYYVHFQGKARGLVKSPPDYESWYQGFMNSAALDDPHNHHDPNPIETNIHQWISECELNHGHLPNGNHSLRATHEIDVVLIDVFQNCLVQGTSSHRFFALSYVWGRVSMLQATTHNRAFLALPGALKKVWSEIPRVIQDAIELVRLLGERYLWVDSLCIEQDDLPQKKHLVMQMDIVYSHAVMTLVSISGSDATAALPGVMPGSRRPSVPVEWIGNHQLAALGPNLESIMENSVYQKRAWTFQEILLSNRCLLFTEHVLFYHCHSRLQSDWPGALGQDVRAQAGLGMFDRSGDDLQFPLPFSCDQDQTLCLDGAPYMHASGAFNTYVSLVQEYSARQLSDRLDALNAFAGILAVLQHRHHWSFICGMPEQYLHLCLLWATPYEAQDEHQRNPAFSSWSWAGWIGPSTWNLMHIFRPHRQRMGRTCQPRILKTEIENLEASDRTLSGTALGRLHSRIGSSLQRAADSGELQAPNVTEDLATLSFQASIVSWSCFEVFKLDLYLSGFGICTDTGLKDACSRHCGVLFESGASTHMSMADHRHSEFVLLSRYHRSVRAFSDTGSASTVSMIPDTYHDICDSTIFPFSPLCLLNVMLIEWKGDRAERLAIGLIHEDAWAIAGPVKKDIILG